MLITLIKSPVINITPTVKINCLDKMFDLQQKQFLWGRVKQYFYSFFFIYCKTYNVRKVHVFSMKTENHRNFL